ncbi:MAG: hypothetical protein M3548_07160 [Actinomycetota bacterium]|nr:hypothetical protein [Actinomycetota bacterium]
MGLDSDGLDVMAWMFANDGCEVKFRVADDRVDIVFGSDSRTQFVMACSPKALETLVRKSAEALAAHGKWMERAAVRDQAEQDKLATYRARKDSDRGEIPAAPAVLADGEPELQPL